MPHARELLDGQAPGRESNRRRLITEIMIKSDRQSRIARRTGLSQATVSASIQELAELGVVETDKAVDGLGKSRGGQVRLRPLSGVAVGVDLGFNHVSVIVRRVDHPFQRVAWRRGASGANTGLRRLLPEVRELIREAVDETGQTMADIVSAGVAVPRMVEPRTGRFTTPVLPPWEPGDDPAAEFTAMLGVPVAMDNDANLGAMAEQIYGAD
ncbi:MAG: ROK family transcriptional regulator, partial [Actinomycetota bacterium]|nr:ROK family transcriptional regulator [Actinomycetota bacterium]